MHQHLISQERIILYNQYTVREMSDNFTEETFLDGDVLIRKRKEKSDIVFVNIEFAKGDQR